MTTSIDEKLHEDLVAYVDGELDEAGRARVEEILETSPDARAVVAELEKLDEVMSTFAVNGPSAQIDFKVEAAARRALERKRPRRLRRVVASSAGLVAAAACAVLVISLFQNRSETDSGRDPGFEDVTLQLESRPAEAQVQIDGEATRGITNDRVDILPGHHTIDLGIQQVPTDGRLGWVDEDGRDRDGDVFGENNAEGNAGQNQTMIIRTARMRLRVDELDRAVQHVEQSVERRDGHIERSTVESHGAVIVARVPSAELDELRQTLRGLGEVLFDGTEAQDVAGEVMDVESRLRSARVTEERLLALAAERTADVDQILAVERELMRVRSQIEQLEGRSSTLRDQVAMSTITIELEERIPERARPSAGERLGDAAKEGVANVGALFLGLGELTAAYGLSFLLLTALAYGIIRLGLWAVRRRKTRAR